MEDILQKIQTMTDCELQKIMTAISQRYRSAYPQWDVIYIALHKEPELRRQELSRILELLSSCTETCLETI